MRSLDFCLARLSGNLCRPGYRFIMLLVWLFLFSVNLYIQA